MWQNVGKLDDGTGSSSVTPSRTHYGPLLRNHLVIHADCASANRGLFAGMVVMVATAVSIIVFFVAFSDRRYVVTVSSLFLWKAKPTFLLAEKNKDFAHFYGEDRSPF